MASRRSQKQERETPVYPLYGSTFTLYRLSPLYHGNASLLGSLNVQARRLRDALTGDTLRGVQVAAELSGAPNASSGGALRTCTWDLIGDEAAWEKAHPQQDEDDDEISTIQPVSTQEACGIHIELKYEKAVHSAVLLGDPLKKSAVSGFTSFPLLLIRMPVPVRDTFLQFLSTTFDARMDPMKLRPSFLGSVLERILEQSGPEPPPDIGLLGKGLQIQLSFPSVTPLLKNIDITLLPSDVSEFTMRGRQLSQHHPHLQNTLNLPQGAEGISPIAGPFTKMLSEYLDSHLAMSLEHPAAVLSKVAVGPFAFSGEGKLKMVDSSPISQELWELILQEAQASRLRTKEEILMESDQHPWIPAIDGRKSRAASSRLPTDPPPPYEEHDPSFRDG